MDLDKKIHGFCKAELRKRFRLVFYPGKLSLAACSEQFGKPERNPTDCPCAPMGFRRSDRPPATVMRQRYKEEGRCATDRCNAATRQSSAVAKSAPPAKHPSLIGYPKHIASLILPREYRSQNEERNRPPKACILHAADLSTKRLFSKGDIILIASRISYRSLIWSI